MSDGGGERSSDFVPSRDLPLLRQGVASDAIVNGLQAIAIALGVAEGQREHIDVTALSISNGSCLDLEQDEDRDFDDNFEQRFVQQWLTRVAGARWVEDFTDEADACIALASKLIAVMSGQAASGRLLRCYALQNGAYVDLDEAAVVEDALGARTWGAAIILANELDAQLSRFLEKADSCIVLELGAGTGLVGLAAAASKAKSRARQIVLTDFDANVLVNLRHNVGLRDAALQCDVAVSRLDWSEPVEQELAGSVDCLLAADCIYERQHAVLVRSVAEQLLREPVAEAVANGKGHASRAKLLLMMPLRTRHTEESNSILQVFPWAVAQEARRDDDILRLCTTQYQDFYGYDDFGPPQLRLQDIQRNALTDEKDASYSALRPRRRVFAYRRGHMYDSPQMGISTTIDSRDGKTCYRLYTIEWQYAIRT